MADNYNANLKSLSDAQVALAVTLSGATVNTYALSMAFLEDTLEVPQAVMNEVRRAAERHANLYLEGNIA